MRFISRQTQSRQIKLFHNKKIIKIFREDRDLGKLIYKRNVKSNLIINLKNYGYENEKFVLEIIGNYELDIADLELKRNNLDQAYDALFSALNSFSRLNKKDLSFKIALKILMDIHFEKRIKDNIFSFIKNTSYEPYYRLSFDYYKYIIDQYMQNSYRYNFQNINKTPLYIFQNLNYRDIIQPTIYPYTISKHPIYSKKLSLHMTLLEKYKAIKLEKHMILPQKNYKLVSGASNAFKHSIINNNKGIIAKMNKLIKEFSIWDTKRIIKWEKKTDLLNYFPTGQRIS